MKSRGHNFKLSFFITLLGIIFALNSPSIYAGDIVGKIVIKTEGNTLFGPVLTSVPVSVIQVQNWVAASNSYIMFNITNNQVYVLTTNRTVIAPTGAIVQNSDVFSFGKD